MRDSNSRPLVPETNALSSWANRPLTTPDIGFWILDTGLPIKTILRSYTMYYLWFQHLFYHPLAKIYLTPKHKIYNPTLNPEFAVAIYCGLKLLAATLVSRFCSSTYSRICLRRKIAPTARFAVVFYTSPRRLLQNLGLIPPDYPLPERETLFSWLVFLHLIKASNTSAK